MSEDRKHRKDSRHNVRLHVCFSEASDFVVEYAENLSVGGLFVVGAQDMTPLAVVEIQLELPGFDLFDLQAKVAHIRTPEMAAKMNREPGAGMQLLKVPPGFPDALRTYLQRLGIRRDWLVLVDDPECLELLSKAGFKTEATHMHEVIPQVLGSTGLLAVVVQKDSAQPYLDILSTSPRQPPIIGCNCVEQETYLLSELDRLAGRLKQ